MDKTQNFFKNVRARLKKYRFDWSTQQVEHDDLLAIKHVNRTETTSKDKKKLFRLKGSAVVASTFLILLGAGAVDAQTRAYEVIYKGMSIGYVDNLQIVKTAVSENNKGKSGRINRTGRDYEIRLVRATKFLTTEEVAKEIVEIRTQEKFEVASMDNPEETQAQTMQEMKTGETAEQTSAVAVSPEEGTVMNRDVMGASKPLEVTAVEIPAIEDPASQTPASTAPEAETVSPGSP